MHPLGNSHYLLDSLNGLRVARLLRDLLTVLRPESADYFSQRYQNFCQRLGTALVGGTLADKHDFEKLAILAEQGQLTVFLKRRGEEWLLGSWLGQLSPYQEAKVVTDHRLALFRSTLWARRC